MKLYVTRHGQTEWNKRGLLCGRTDVPLSAEGIAQAHRLAEQLRGRRIDRIFVSPLQRARETARIVAEAVGAPVVVEKRLIEQSYGSLEGTPRDGEAAMRAKSQPATRFPGGESMLQAAHRVYGLLDELRALPLDCALLVAHNGICRVARSYFCDMQNDAFCYYKQPNCGLVEYELTPDWPPRF